MRYEILFCEEGRENFHVMKKDWFQVKNDGGVQYIVKVKDKETKNHNTMDEAITSEIMPEMPGDKYCPVSSYIHYMNALSQQSDSLWQTPIFTPFPVNGKST